MNTDVLWPDRELAEAQVRRIQIKLHQWAIDDPDRRFDDVFNLVHDPAVLVAAWARVRGNKGKRAAGVDGLRPSSILAAEEAFLPGLRADLKSREFTPLPVRERMIPKPATAKRRRLGIPTARDRTVQAALKLVLEPIFEATSSHPRMASGLDGARRTRSRRSTSSLPAPMSGCWRVTSKRAST